MTAKKSAIERLINPTQDKFSTELAEYLLDLDFSKKDHALYARLSAKAHEGSLTDAEKRTLDDLLNAADFLTLLQLKASASLERRNPARVS